MAKRPRKARQEPTTPPLPQGTYGVFTHPSLQQILEPGFTFLPGQHYLFAYNAERHTLAQINQWLLASTQWYNGKATIHYYCHDTPYTTIMAHRYNSTHYHHPMIGVIGLPATAFDMEPMYVPHTQLADSVFVVDTNRFVTLKHCQHPNLPLDRIQATGPILPQ